MFAGQKIKKNVNDEKFHNKMIWAKNKADNELIIF
jgi:hypothetical protein